MNKRIFLVLSFLLMIIAKVAVCQDTIVIEKIVGVVGNNPIFLSDVENQYTESMMRNTIFDGDPRCEIFEGLLTQKLLLTQAQVDSLQVSDKEVDSELTHRLDMFVRQIGSVQKLEEYYKKPMADIKEDLRDVIREQMLTQKMRGKIAGDLKVTPTEVQGFYNKIPKDSLPIVEAEYELAQICIYPKIKLEEKIALRKKLDELRVRIVNGSSFEAMARLYSEDPGSAAKGGELGFMSRAELVQEYASVAFNLQPGEVSAVVESDFGLHIIQMIEKRGNLANTRHILFTQKASYKSKALAKSALDSLTNLLRKSPERFDEIALVYSEDDGSKKNGGLVLNPATGNSKFLSSQIDPATNYVIKTMNVGELSNPFEAMDEKGKTVYKIVKIKNKTKPHTANMKEDFQKIHDLALADKQNKTMEDWLTKKQKYSYIHIDNHFKTCKFKSKGWLKM